MLDVVLDLAESEGWPGDYHHDDLDEFGSDIWDEAEEWLNDNVADDNHFFGSSEAGDWGYFEIDEIRIIPLR